MNRKEFRESSLEQGKTSSCFCLDWWKFLKSPPQNKKKESRLFEKSLNKIDSLAKRTDITLDNQTSGEHFPSIVLEIETFETKKLIEIKSQNENYSLLMKITDHKFSKSIEKNNKDVRNSLDLKNMHVQKALNEEFFKLLAEYLAMRSKCDFLADFSGDNDQLSFAV